MPLETPTKQCGSNQKTVSNENFSTPPLKMFVSVAESVKRKIIPDDGATPPKKAKKPQNLEQLRKKNLSH